MEVKQLIGINQFETAANVCAVIELVKVLGMDHLQMSIEKARKARMPIYNMAFAQQLFGTLCDWAEMQEQFLEDFFEEYEKCGEAMTALNASKNRIILGEV